MRQVESIFHNDSTKAVSYKDYGSLFVALRWPHRAQIHQKRFGMLEYRIFGSFMQNGVYSYVVTPGNDPRVGNVLRQQIARPEYFFEELSRLDSASLARRWCCTTLMERPSELFRSLASPRGFWMTK